MAVRRMVQAGVVPITWMAVLARMAARLGPRGDRAGAGRGLAQHGGGSGVAFAWEMQLLHTPSPTRPPGM